MGTEPGTAPAISEPQKEMSPRISSLVTLRGP
jgi:hypothetical protein